MMSSNINGYKLTSFKIIPTDGLANFDINIVFERNSNGTNGILINYHLMCAILVIAASINFLFEPRDTNRSCLLVALILVLASIFSDAQVKMF